MTPRLAATVAALVLGGLGAAEARAGEPLDVHAVHQRAADVRAYWTAARMRDAIPIAVRASPSPRPGRVRSAGAPSYALPADPGRPDRSVGLRRGAVDVSADNTTLPRRVHGKVFLTLAGTDYFCSATVVDSASHSLVWTAGHCVNGADIGAGFATNWTFVPGYRSGETPFGSWPATRLLTTAGWRDRADLRLDEGAATLVRDVEGRGIEDVVGARGIAFNQRRDASFDAYGYPALDASTPPLPPDFDGEHLFRCSSPRTGNDTPPGFGPPTLEIDCNMSAGSSGGGWVIGGRFVNSVTSYGYGFDGGHLYGPYFGDVAARLYSQASGPRLLCAGRAVTNLGGPGQDELSGNERPDSFRLGRGADQARGLGGSDAACGGGGGDGLRGGAGADKLSGQGGGDLLIGGRGRDVCDGGPGTDAARGCEVRRRIP